MRERIDAKRQVCGPLLAAAALVLLGTGPASAATTFTHTGSEQSYTVPPGTWFVKVRAVGARGGDGGEGFAAGGKGAEASAILPVTPGQLLFVLVGGNGASGGGIGPAGLGAPGWNGGGAGGAGNNSTGGGGGGASDVRTVSCGAGCPGTPESLASRLLVAAGGGGSGGFGAAGGDAGAAGSSAGSGEGGEPGGESGGGAGGDGGSDAGGAGTLGQGGAGGAVHNGGGGGGGGLYGGGGGASSGGGGGASGGGGSSWISAAALHPEGPVVSDDAAVVEIEPLGVQLSATTLSFGPVLAGRLTGPQTVTASPFGSALAFGPARIVGPQRDDFLLYSTCLGTLAPGAGCAIDVRFYPLGEGARNATLQLPTDLLGETTTVALSGIGAAKTKRARDAARPNLWRLRLAPRRFRATTRISFLLSKPATVRFAVERALPGRQGRFRLLRGGFVQRAKAGRSSLRFSGRLRGRKLPPGGYRLRAVAIDKAGKVSQPRRSGFRVLRPARR